MGAKAGPGSAGQGEDALSLACEQAVQTSTRTRFPTTLAQVIGENKRADEAWESENAIKALGDIRHPQRCPHRESLCPAASALRTRPWQKVSPQHSAPGEYEQACPLPGLQPCRTWPTGTVSEGSHTAPLTLQLSGWRVLPPEKNKSLGHFPLQQVILQRVAVGIQEGTGT